MRASLGIGALVALVAVFHCSQAQAGSMSATPITIDKATAPDVITLPDITVTFGSNLTYMDDMYIRLNGASVVNTAGVPTVTCSLYMPPSPPGSPPTQLVEWYGDHWRFQLRSMMGAVTGDNCKFSVLKIAKSSLGVSGEVTASYEAKKFQIGQTLDLAGPILVVVPPPPPNQQPTADAGGPYAVAEGSSVTVSATGSDPEGGALTYAWDLDNNGSFETAGQSVTLSANGLDGPVSKTISVRVTDVGGLSAVAAASVNIQNVAPTVTINAPADGALFASSDFVQVNATFSDPGVGESHTCTVSFGDGSEDIPVACTQATGVVASPKSYQAAGVYSIWVTVQDDDGGIGDAQKFIVVYDPSAGYVSGEGWIQSPAGAYRPAPDKAGKASFGFVSKYRKGATVPDGNMQFVFQAGDLNFHSTAYEWLVVSGSTKAQFKGFGTVNGYPNYGFLLSVTDAADNPKVKDTFRIKIWDKTNGDAVVYDNGAEQRIGGGSIVISTVGKK